MADRNWEWCGLSNFPFQALPPDLTLGNLPGRDCRAGWRRWMCTRLPGHTGRHAAGDGECILAVWE